MNQTSIQLYQPTEIKGEYIALPYLPQEMIDLIFKIKDILEEADRQALENHKYNLNYIHQHIKMNVGESILEGREEGVLVALSWFHLLMKSGFMILDTTSPEDHNWEGKYIPGTYNNYLKIKELPYFKRAFTCYEAQEGGSPFHPIYQDYIDGVYSICFADVRK
tara:strand:+ start:547 stop:1038 length:492 start_codon:yes stop_codon:yes gene_type:complete